jgi:hypothetical protein
MFAKLGIESGTQLEPRPASRTVRLSPLPVQMVMDFTVRGCAMGLIDRDAERGR